MRPATLSRHEIVALAAIAKLAEDAYGVTIREEINRHTGRMVSLAGVYLALDRLDRLGLVTARLGDPRPAPGGRARRHYTLTDAGRSRVREERALALKLWRDVPLGPSRTRR